MTSKSALRLCELLASWPRQAIHSWLFSVSSPQQRLASKECPPAIQKRRKKLAGFESEAWSEKTQIFSILDDEFPPLLKMIPDPPLVLFCLGDISVLAQRTIAIVGARKCTTVGKLVAEKLAEDLAQHGICTISGLAYGIDAAAHKGALSQTKGCTAAFLGAGLGHIYPRQNKHLGQKIIAEGGALLSEYPHKIEPRPYQFPERNRLISGSAWATIMVEAGEQSGSLITARMALEQGREVFAVPGSPLSAVSKGCHRMIRQGAGLVTDAREVIEEMGWSNWVNANAGVDASPLASNAQVATAAAHESNARPPQDAGATDKSAEHRETQLSAVGQRVLNILSPYGMSLDEISLVCSDNPQSISQSLVELQLAGFVRQGLGGYILVS